MNKNKRATYLQTISELQRRYLRAQWALKYVVFSLTCTKKESGCLLLVDASPDLLEVKPTVKLVGRRCARSLAHLLIRVALTRCKVSVTRMGHQHTPCRVFFDGRCTISRWLEHLTGAAEVTRAHLTPLNTCCWGEFVHIGTSPLVHLRNGDPFQTTQCKLYEAFVYNKLCLPNVFIFGSVAFGLLGNKGMHSMHGNTSKPGLPFPMPDEPWEIAVKAITGQLNYDIEESMWENPKLHQALAWSLADSVGWKIPKGEIIEQIILARLHKTKFLGDPLSYEYKYANWERSAYYILDGITSVLENNKVKDVIGNPYLHGVPKDKLVRPPANPKKLLFKAARLSFHKSFAVKVCLQQKKCEHITEISCCLELISLKPFNLYKWWANGRLSGLKRQLPYMGNHKASQHVPLWVVNSEEYKVPTCTVQSPKILKVQQVALVALVLKWNSYNYRTWNPFTIKGNNNICGGDIHCCPSPHRCKAQMIPLTNRDGQVSCLDRLGSIPCLTQSSANWSAC